MLRFEGVSFYILSIYRGHLAGILFDTLTLIPRSGLKGAGCTNYLLGWRLLAFPLLAKVSFGIKGKEHGIFGKGGKGGMGERGRGPASEEKGRRDTSVCILVPVIFLKPHAGWLEEVIGAGAGWLVFWPG